MTQTEMDWLAPLQITSVVQLDQSVLYFIRKQTILAPGGFISTGKGYKVLGTGCRALEKLLKADGWMLHAPPHNPTKRRWTPPVPF